MRRLAALAACGILAAGCGAQTVRTHTAIGATRHPTATTTPAATTAACHSTNGLPDQRCTPGAVNPNVTQANIKATICKAGWTATVRPPTSYTNALKVKDLAAYGDSGPMSSWELDHRVPLAVGGNPTAPSNLWPEPWDGTLGAHTKDVIEVKVQHLVCAGTLTLAAGQAVFLGNYFAWKAP